MFVNRRSEKAGDPSAERDDLSRHPKSITLTQMYDDSDDRKDDNASAPKVRLAEKLDELRIHADLCAIFEGPRKFDAKLITGVDADLIRDVQQIIAKLDKSKQPGKPFLTPARALGATTLFDSLQEQGVSTSDYHLYRRPGEVMIVRWIKGDEVDTFYKRLQAHMDVAIKQTREDERQALAWKNDPRTNEYLEALDEAELDMQKWWMRDLLRDHELATVRTQTADEINIGYIADFIMGVGAAALVGEEFAPPGGADDSELAWFFKLFALCGTKDGVEHIVFFVFLQKTDDEFDFGE